MTRPCTCDNCGPLEFDVNSQHCYACWCWYYRADMRMRWGGPAEPPRLPTPDLSKQVSNFARAAVDIAGSFFAVVPDDVKRVRLDVCESCEEFTGNRKCNACGCFMDWKSGWATMKCPKGKWSAQNVDPSI